MRILTPLVAIAVIATLSACGPTPAPVTPGASSSPKPTETVEAVEELDPVPALIVIARESLTIVDSEGTTTDDFDYVSDPAAAVARLTTVFGSSPVISNDDGNFHEWPSVVYTWSGFSVIDYIGGGSIPFGADFEVASSTAAVNDVDIESTGGVSVGDSTTTATAAGGTAFSEVYDVTVSWVEIDAIPSPDPEWADWVGGPRVFVRLALDAPSGSVTTIAAPMVNYYV